MPDGHKRFMTTFSCYSLIYQLTTPHPCHRNVHLYYVHMYIYLYWSWFEGKDFISCSLCVPIHVNQNVDTVGVDAVCGLAIVWDLRGERRERGEREEREGRGGGGGRGEMERESRGRRGGEGEGGVEG